MKRILILTCQPPPAQGVQSIRYAKLSAPLKELGWEVHFLGPDPNEISVRLLPRSLFMEPFIGHYIQGLNLRHLASVRRRQTKGMKNLLWVIVQVLAVVGLKLKILDDHESKAEYHIFSKMDQDVDRLKFDLIAGIQPNFFYLSAASDLAKKYDVPFVAIFDDPYGHRSIDGFTPAKKKNQAEILNHASQVVFASHLTMIRYQQLFHLSDSKVSYISDSFIATQGNDNFVEEALLERNVNEVLITHLGDLSEWRPIEPLIAAIRNINAVGKTRVSFDNFGYMYSNAKAEIKNDPDLNCCVNISSSLSYVESHKMALYTDCLLVVVGPRHVDNVPSKLYEYLSAKKPILLLSPPQNPARELIESLAIGVWADVSSRESILEALEVVILKIADFERQYKVNRDRVDKFEASRVAEIWSEKFGKAILGCEK